MKPLHLRSVKKRWIVCTIHLFIDIFMIRRNPGAGFDHASLKSVSRAPYTL